jgi:hypothetical protein
VQKEAAGVDITVYLPDELGKKAKEAKLPFSQLLRGAVEDELARQQAVADTLTEVEEHELDVETPEGSLVTGRLVGTCIAGPSRSDVSAYLTSDGRILVYDLNRLQVHDVTQDAVEALTNWFNDDNDAYIEAMEAIGEKPVIDL